MSPFTTLPVVVVDHLHPWQRKSARGHEHRIKTSEHRSCPQPSASHLSIYYLFHYNVSCYSCELNTIQTEYVCLVSNLPFESWAGTAQHRMYLVISWIYSSTACLFIFNTPCRQLDFPSFTPPSFFARSLQCLIFTLSLRRELSRVRARVEPQPKASFHNIVRRHRQQPIKLENKLITKGMAIIARHKSYERPSSPCRWCSVSCDPSGESSHPSACKFADLRCTKLVKAYHRSII